MGTLHIPRIAEKTQAIPASTFPRIGQPDRNHGVSIPWMDYKEEIGRRLKSARQEKGWTLSELSLKTDDKIGLKRISSYENGDRMIGPQEAVILAKALEVRPAYLMAVDDTQMPITPQEEALVRNWRTLSEKDRMEVFRRVQTMALQSRDPVQDATVQRHLPIPQQHPKVAAHKRVRRRVKS
jgi:transcriptional regulator with XRE-family HTH domain